MKIALVHDYLVDRGGAERVFFLLADLLPEAELFAAAVDLREFPELRGTGRPIHTSFLGSLGRTKRALQSLAPVLPLAMQRLDLSRFDIVLSHSTGFAHHARAAPHARHICYCHTPPRFLYRSRSYFRGRSGRILATPALALMRSLDRRAASRVHRYIANSENVARRIRSTYSRSAEVLHPPVDLRRFAADPVPPNGRFLVVSRLLPYKRIDLAIEAANAGGLPLDVVGEGSERERLRAMAGPTVRFLGRLTDDEVSALMRSCQAVIVPGEEDFGLTPVEAQASGRPPIVYAAGGALETVIDGVNGFRFAEQSASSLVAALLRARAIPLDPTVLRSAAGRFGVPAFAVRLRAIIDDEARRLS